MTLFDDKYIYEYKFIEALLTVYTWRGSTKTKRTNNPKTLVHVTTISGL